MDGQWWHSHAFSNSRRWDYKSLFFSWYSPIGQSYKKKYYIYVYCIDAHIWKEKRKDYLFLFAALTEKSGKNCDKGELYKTIAEKYKACMRDMLGRAPGTAMGQGGGMEKGGL